MTTLSSPPRSSSGVVNVYSSDACLQESNPKPIKAIMNLLTPISSLRFNSTTEILAIASNAADEAVRLVGHLFFFMIFVNLALQYLILRVDHFK